MRTAAILPVKRLALAKQRLAQSLADPLRTELARAMIADVLGALAECDPIERTIVVTNEPGVAAAARAGGSLVVEDSAEQGQSAAVSIGIASALQQGFERALCVPGDCPTLDPRELEELLDGACDGASPLVVIVPDRHGTGTNGLLLWPPDAIAPSFGPDSFKRHRSLAADAGVSCEVRSPPSLLLDVDTGDDLRLLGARLQGTAPRAARTRAALGYEQSVAAAPVMTA